MVSVTVVIPNRREAHCGDTVERIYAALSNRGLQTTTLIQVSNDPTGRGVGWALREGLRAVRTPWVVFAMADGSEDPYAVANMVAHCTEDVSAVWGDRWDLGVVIGYPRVKWLLNRLGNHLIARLQGSTYTDWTDLAKAYRVSTLRRVIWSDDFRCEIEIPIRYLRTRPGCRLAFVPMRWTERTVGRSSYRLTHVGAMLRTLFTIWREDHR